MAEPIIPSIAARKAARKKSQYSSDVTPQVDVPVALPAESVQAASSTPTVPSAVDAAPLIFNNARSSDVQPQTSVHPAIPTTQEIAGAQSKPQSASYGLTPELLIRLAKQHGLNLAPEKREFTKHTYSITPDRKDRMKKYTEVLSINMQDAICEAFDLFFEKHKQRFDAIQQARNT